MQYGFGTKVKTGNSGSQRVFTPQKGCSVRPQANSFPVSCCVVSAGRPKKKFSPQMSSLAPFSSSYHSSHNVACRSCTLDISQSLDLRYFKIQENSFVNFPSVIHCPPANTNYSNNQPASHHHISVWADGLAAVWGWGPIRIQEGSHDEAVGLWSRLMELNGGWGERGRERTLQFLLNFILNIAT